tara:strand:- start:401 stop:856 length:456 start_codon:yes stop_codon:yes gene_type:complete
LIYVTEKRPGEPGTEHTINQREAMKTTILTGIIIIGSAAAVFAASPSATDPATNDPGVWRQGVANGQAQDMAAPWNTLPNGKTACPWAVPHEVYGRGIPDSQPLPNVDGAAYNATHSNRCHHWYSWMVPGHSARCGRHTDSMKGTPTGCCW